MNSTLKSIALVGAGMLAAGAGFWIWEAYLSRDAQIAALHRACLDEFAAGRAKAKPEITAKPAPNESGTAFLQGLSERLGKFLEGVSGSMGKALCDELRDACRADFDGRICRVARERYP